MGPYGPIWAHMGPYGPVWARPGTTHHTKPFQKLNFFCKRGLCTNQPCINRPSVDLRCSSTRSKSPKVRKKSACRWPACVLLPLSIIQFNCLHPECQAMFIPARPSAARHTKEEDEEKNKTEVENTLGKPLISLFFWFIFGFVVLFLGVWV